MDDLDDDVAVPCPLAFMIRATPRSRQASLRATDAWTSTVGKAARDRIARSRHFTCLDRRPLSVTTFYVPPAFMQGGRHSLGEGHRPSSADTEGTDSGFGT
ncbi:hypothetical protein VP06_28115 [Methylobacterium aquaticum]|jgi:hypothetical protein|uniref:Uncharacterized protein n=1 Tax=Methylobacterium aquaticum TaxID=270351 RepID=A0A0J6UQC3_9HYPH|nr:hypothetical protein VP06_28115 [Methylobacterium aquaticum]